MTQVTINKLNHEGRGIAYIEGKTVFVDGALPGETAIIHYTKNKKNYAEAYAVTIHECSAERITPSCPHFYQCGGCQLQYLKPNQQLNHKAHTLAEQLWHFAHVQPQKWLKPISSPYWGYRRKARLGAKYVAKKNRLVLGFREKHNPRFVNDSYTCLVLVPEIGHKIDWLASQLNRTTIRDAIPQIEIAAGDDQLALVIRHLRPIEANDTAILHHIGQATGWYIYLQPGKPHTVHAIYPQETNPLLSYQLPKHAITIGFHPLDFTQVNGIMNRHLVDQAIHLLNPSPQDHIIDLFSGVGNFALPLARYAYWVTGIEGEQAMVERAQANAQRNGIANSSFYAVDLNQPYALSNHPVDKLLLDPPRSGAQNALAHLLPKKPRRIVYVSCNTATLARDAGFLAQKNYTMTHAGIMDMFPHTKHVESIAVFEPNE